jgi:hypothetical protein
MNPMTKLVAVALLLRVGPPLAMPHEAPAGAVTWRAPDRPDVRDGRSRPVRPLVTVTSPTQISVSARNDTRPWTGDLSLRVATGAAVDLTQVPPDTDAGHPLLGGDPHRRAWVFTGALSGVAVQDTRPDQPGWAVTGQLSALTAPSGVTARHLGWAPSLVTAGSDAEGTVTAGPAIDPLLKTPASNGLAAPGAVLASTVAGSGLGTQHLGASFALWLPDTTPVGLLTATLTLTLVSP